MASVAFDRGLTFAPFRRMFGDVQEAVLLADSFFAFPQYEQELETREEPKAIVPQVMSLPNRQRFELAVAQWLTDIEFDSLPDEMTGHESFREIVNGGVAVAPLIAAHLRRRPSFLFLALETIFEEDPVPDEAYGNLQTTVAAWLRWLRH